MAIYDRGYRSFEGERTPVWSRFTVPARYGLRDAFSSKFFLLFFLICLLWPLAFAVLIYLRYNSEALAVLNLGFQDLFVIDAQAGLVNARNALEFVLARVPEVDPKRIYAAGHSSAGTLALLFAEPLDAFTLHSPPLWR